MVDTNAAAAPGLGPFGPLITLWRHRRLIGRLARRELASRYRGSVLGLVWSGLTPFMMLAVYTFVFSSVFQTRWTANSQNTGEFALFLFAGLTFFGILADNVNRAPGLILENTAYIKTVIFPLEVMPAVTVASALVSAGINMVILMLFYGPVFGVPPVTALLAPLVLIPHCLLVLGLCWFLSAAGVFLRDIRQFIAVLTTLLMFLSPIFYPAAAVPESVRTVIELNPLAPMLELWRACLFAGTPFDIVAFAKALALGWAVAWAGHACFIKARKAFADVV
ncbi:sugar ABC transporter permease [Niveispirillum lacus]|uniref:Transport permease protein n=1 Tax=Niveispirillum lacus TaxID=1981099 RepID=A0A255Z654_9PROT|nr:ABC transporter permease [Niveispirillum lacus]OYQ36912.1 sugar ABC transporter permease [Niveispirillum lacus]